MIRSMVSVGNRMVFFMDTRDSPVRNRARTASPIVSGRSGALIPVVSSKGELLFAPPLSTDGRSSVRDSIKMRLRYGCSRLAGFTPAECKMKPSLFSLDAQILSYDF
jgi:hypothetical protein